MKAVVMATQQLLDSRPQRFGHATIRRVVPFAGAAGMLVLSPLGPAWLQVAANPAAKLPEMALSFGDLHDLTSSGAAPTNGIQEVYFGWLGWILVLATVVVAAAFVATRRVEAAILVAVIAVVGLAITALGVKGPLTWSQLFEQAENIRLGGYLMVLGYLVTLIAGLVGARQRG